MQVYVVTNMQERWDCVCGVYLSIESLLNYFKNIFSSDWENCSTIDDVLERIEDSTYYVLDITAK